MKFGLTDKTISNIQDVFIKYPQIEKVIIYGSRAKGNYKNGSDIDLTLYGQKLSQQILLSVFNELDELLLPYTIDLSIFDDIDNINLRDHINRVGLAFYVRNLI